MRAPSRSGRWIRRGRSLLITSGGLDLREEKPRRSEAKDRARQQAQKYIALAPAKKLRAAIQRHGNHREEPELPVQRGELGATVERKGQSRDQHRAIDRHAARAETHLIASDIEGVRGCLAADEAIGVKDAVAQSSQ